MKKIVLFHLSALLLICSVIIAACDSRQTRMNTDVLFHSGDLRGYATVYIQDYSKGVSYRDNNSEDELNFPVYEKDGCYTIEYRGTEYTLKELDEPVQLLGTESYFLRYSFGDGVHYIERIPSGY